MPSDLGKQVHADKLVTDLSVEGNLRAAVVKREKARPPKVTNRRWGKPFVRTVEVKCHSAASEAENDKARLDNPSLLLLLKGL